jgi:tetratricopeptide (TPR) repeat protein
MTEMLDRITPEMSEEEVLGVILDEIMARAEPDMAEAIRFCAIPHWFNEEIIAWLRGEGLKPSQRSGEILAALTELTFVGPYYERGWAYHENVRDLLLRRWRERDGQEFKELSGRAAGYFERKLGEGKAALARLFAAIRRVLGKVETLTEDEREEYRREHMYHFLAADAEQGFDLFGNMFNRARSFYQLSTCALLLQLAEEQETHLSAEDRLWLRFRQGQLAYASAQWLEALGIFEGLWREELPLSLKSTLANDLGLLYQDKGEWERAIEYYERSLAIDEKVGDEHGMAPTLNNLGSVYQVKGEWERAIEYYERSLLICEKVGDEHGMATTFNNLGLVYQDKGEWERAIEHYERSLAITEKIGDEYMVARTFNNLGSVYQAKEEWERAIEYYERSLAIKKKVGDEHGMAPSFNNLGDVYQAKGEWERAIEYYERSLAILEKVGDEVRAATTMYNIASLYEDMDRYDEAVELLERVVEIDERVGHPDLESDRKALERVKRKAK